MTFEFPGKYYEIIRKDFRDLAGETDFLASLLPDGGRALDLGCGTGTNLRALGERGFSGVGVDQSKSFIDFAIKAGGENVEYVHCSMTDYDTEEHFDLAYSVFGTLNLVPHTELPALLASVRRWLRPGAHLVLDIGHMLNFVDNFQPFMVVHHEGDGVLITRLARQLVNPHTANWRNEETLLVCAADGAVTMHQNFFDQVVVTAPALRLLLDGAGFAVIAEYGSFRKDPASAMGKGHLIMVARAEKTE